MIIISYDEEKVPEGYRKLTDEEIVQGYLNLDMNHNYNVSKNEWMLNFIKILADDIDALEKDGPDSLMNKIQELSDEFDRFDSDHNKYLDYEEYRSVILNNVYISE